MKYRRPAAQRGRKKRKGKQCYVTKKMGTFKKDSKKNVNIFLVENSHFLANNFWDIFKKEQDLRNLLSKLSPLSGTGSV